MIGVASGMDVAADADHADAEQLAPRPGQRRVNLRILAVGIGFESHVRLAYQRRDPLRGRQVTGRDEKESRLSPPWRRSCISFSRFGSEGRADAGARSPTVSG